MMYNNNSDVFREQTFFVILEISMKYENYSINSWEKVINFLTSVNQEACMKIPS